MKHGWLCGLTVAGGLIMKKFAAIAAGAFLLMSISAAGGQQSSAASQVRVQQGGENPIYKITIKCRGTYHEGSQLQAPQQLNAIDFRGTPLLATAKGMANVESKAGTYSNRCGIRQTSAGDAFRSRISDIRHVGDHPGGRRDEPRRGPADMTRKAN